MRKRSQTRFHLITICMVAVSATIFCTSAGAAQNRKAAHADLVISANRFIQQQEGKQAGKEEHPFMAPGSESVYREALFGDRTAGMPPETTTTKIATLALLSLADYFQTVDFLYQQRNIIGMNYYYFVNTGRESRGVVRMSRSQYYSIPQNYQSYAVQAPVYEVSWEDNPVLGRRPRRENLLAFGAAGLGVTFLLSYMLPEPWGAMALNSVLASETGNVLRNAAMANQRGGWDRVATIPVMMSFRF